MKTCSRCHIEKDDSEFRLRTETRTTPAFKYLNNTCRECDAAVANEYHNKKKHDHSYREKAATRTRKNYWLNRDKRISRQREVRKTTEYKKKMREYRNKNKGKIYQQEVITKKRYHEKHRDGLTDEYIIRQLITQGVGERKTIMAYPEIIEAKRIQLLIKRQIKNGQH